MKTETLQIRLPKELKERFVDVTNKNAINRSEIIRRMIEKYLEEEENNISKNKG